jgi:hypothetical protein
MDPDAYNLGYDKALTYRISPTSQPPGVPGSIIFHKSLMINDIKGPSKVVRNINTTRIHIIYEFVYIVLHRSGIYA